MSPERIAAERAEEFIEVMPEDPYERMMGIARRLAADRSRLKQEARALKARVAELEGWVNLVAEGYGPYREPKEILDDIVAEAKRLVAGQPAVEPQRRRSRYRWDDSCYIP